MILNKFMASIGINEQQQNILLANKQLVTDKDKFPYGYMKSKACKPKPVSRQLYLAEISCNRVSGSSLLGHTCL
jgi:hypothetical protein